MNSEYRNILYRAARLAFESVMTAPPGLRFTLWHAPGRLELLAGDQTADGMEPVQGSSEVPWHALTAEQFVTRIDSLARSLPILQE